MTHEPALLTQYLQFLQYERLLSPQTLKAYQRLLSKALSWLGNDDRTERLQQYLLHERKRGLDPQSLNLIRAALRGYYQFAEQQGARPDNPAAQLKIPKKAQHPLPKTLSIEQIDILLRPSEESSEETSDIQEARDLAILELFYSSGMRLSELAALNVDDVREQELLIKGKGGVERVVFIGRRAQSALQRWLVQRAQLAPAATESALFLSYKRRQRLSQRAIQLLIKARANRALYGQNVHPHMLRHSFASHMLQSSQDIRAVQELLGHQRLSTTQIYTHLDHQHLSKVYDNAHPRAKRKRS